MDKPKPKVQPLSAMFSRTFKTLYAGQIRVAELVPSEPIEAPRTDARHD